MLPKGLDTFSVGHDFENASIEHCLFRLTRQLPLMQQCTADMLFWFLPLFETVSRFARITTVATFAGIPTSYALSFIGIITHFATSVVLRKSFPTDSSDKSHARYAGYSYFLNPLLAVSCLMSPVPSMLHLLLAVANYSALTGRKLLLYACLSLLVSGHFAFICAAPAYIILLRATATQHALSTNNSRSRSLTRNGSPVRWVTAAIAAVAVSVMILPYLELSSASMTAQNEGFLGVSRRLMRFMSDQAQKVRHRCHERKSLNHEPSANFMWYMDVQVFSKFSDYFLILIPGQPFLFVFPLLIRMSPRRPLHTVNLTVAIVMFFRRETSYSDICFLVSLFLTYHSSSILRSNCQLSNASIASSLPSNMKSLPLISLAAVSTMTLSPLMMALWTVQGSGNANFPFFQALALWTFFALAIIEFSNQVMSEIDNDSADIDPNISDLHVEEYEKQNLIKKD